MQFSIKRFMCITLLASIVNTQAARNGNCCATECNPGNTTVISCDFSECCDNTLKCCNDDHVYFSRTHFSARPQGSNSARHLLGSRKRTHVFGESEFYVNTSIAVEYSQTFDRSNNCARTLGTWFSPECSNKITFGPDQNAAVSTATGVSADLKSQVNVRGLDFGLSGTHKSTVTLKPRIQNVVVDLDFWFGLDDFMCGLWARVNVPLVWSKWQLCACETPINEGSSVYGPGSLVQCPGFITTPAPVTGSPAVVYSGATAARDAWCGDKPFGQVPALRFGKLCNRKNDTFNVSGLRFDLGYDFWNEEKGHLGVGLVAVAGLGTKSCAERLFQPVVGAQRSWQGGLTINGSYELWNSNAETSVTLLTDTTLTHVFKHRQQRLFGLKGRGPWSHYLMLKQFTRDATGTAYVFNGFERAANILAGYVKVKNDVMVDSSWALAYNNCNWGATAGLNFWYRSRDKISDSCGFGIEEGRYGIRGITGCDAKTASLSTINTSSGVGLNNTVFPGTAPTGQVALENGVPFNVDDGYQNTFDGTANTITLKSTDVDPCPGLHPDALSVKVFGSLEYAWEDCDWKPFVLIGGEVEFGRGNAAVDQWGVLFKGGVTF